jgi:hypothetical protein
MTNPNSNILNEERRKRPTPGLSWYTFSGRRERFSKDRDLKKGGYIDRYSARLFLMLVIILGLNVLDVMFTTFILDHEGYELNPLARSAIEAFGDKFWMWKYGIVSVCLILLCLHIKFKGVKTILVTTGTIYFVVVLYQIFLISFQLPKAF